MSHIHKKKKLSIHLLVLETFVGPRPDGLMCCHRDGNPANNRLDNLRWDTAAANEQDKMKHGRSGSYCGEKHQWAKLTEADVRQIRADPRPQKIIAAQFGVVQACISRIKTRKIWKKVL